MGFTDIHTRTAIWQTAETFGAIPSTSLTSKITHCIAATLGTEKTYRANKLGVPVVWQGWFWESVNLWERQDEEAWLAMKQAEGAGVNGGPTPGPSSPNTPTKGRLGLDDDFGVGGNGDLEAEHDFGDLGDLGDGWDDEAQAELDAFLEGSSDAESEAGTRYVPLPTSYIKSNVIRAGKLTVVVPGAEKKHLGHHPRNG